MTEVLPTDVDITDAYHELACDPTEPYYAGGDVQEGYDGYTDSYYGRTWRDAPDIDGSVSFTCGYELNEGDFVDVEIFDVNEYDLIGEVI